MEELRGKSALVTGAALRIGRAAALALADHGVNVVVHYRNSKAEAEKVAAEIHARGAQAWTVKGDLAEPAETEAVFRSAVAAAGTLDILINSASMFPRDTLRTAPLESFFENINVNALAPFVLARRFAGAFTSTEEGKGRRGAIINFLDSRITDYDGAHAAYHLSKLVLFALTRMMSLEFAPQVRVNAVAPGLILPPAGEDESYLAKFASTNPLNAFGDLADVTEAVLFLLRSTFVTGQVLFVDGGRHMRGSVYGL
jgi:pteridine reductase